MLSIESFCTANANKNSPPQTPPICAAVKLRTSRKAFAAATTRMKISMKL